MVLLMVMVAAMLLFGMWMLPAEMIPVAAPYVYGIVLVLSFWSLRTKVREFVFA